ncbi:hypothetical protein ABPG74_006172 [Tetrahymena malaccensis]
MKQQLLVKKIETTVIGMGREKIKIIQETRKHSQQIKFKKKEKKGKNNQANKKKNQLRRIQKERGKTRSQRKIKLNQIKIKQICLWGGENACKFQLKIYLRKKRRKKQIFDLVRSLQSKLILFQIIKNRKCKYYDELTGFITQFFQNLILYKSKMKQTDPSVSIRQRVVYIRDFQIFKIIAIITLILLFLLQFDQEQSWAQQQININRSPYLVYLFI